MRDPDRRARRTGWCATPSTVEQVEPLTLKGKAGAGTRLPAARRVGPATTGTRAGSTCRSSAGTPSSRVLDEAFRRRRRGRTGASIVTIFGDRRASGSHGSSEEFLDRVGRRGHDAARALPLLRRGHHVLADRRGRPRTPPASRPTTAWRRPGQARGAAPATRTSRDASASAIGLDRAVVLGRGDVLGGPARCSRCSAARRPLGRAGRRHPLGGADAARSPRAFVVDECHAPVLLLCSSRRELLEEHPEWGGAHGRFSTLTLEPLEADESARVMQNLLGRRRPGRLDGRTRDRRRRRATRCIWSRCCRC